MSSFANDRAPRSPRSASVAAGLSFLWPGLGQWYAGRNRNAALYAVPAVVLLGIVLLRIAAGIQTFAISMLEPSVALTVLVLIIVGGIWRLLAMVDASSSVNRRTVFRGRPGQVLAVLGAVIFATHATLGYYAWSFYENGSQIFVGDGPDATPDPAGSADPTDDFIATPFATPETPDARVTILLTGIDKTAERTHSLTDTLLVLSLEPTTGEVAMVSIPRDIAQFPLYNGGTFEGKINSLYVYAKNHPEQFPDGPLPSLTQELSYLLGIPIHYYAAVDIDGFKRMIDEVGGVTVTLDRALSDPRYNWLNGEFGLYIPKGTSTLDGETALAFVRSRYGAGDNDFTRAARQQVLLLALRKKVTDPAMLPRIPALLDVAGDTIRTNFPPERIDEMVALAQSIDDATVQRFVLKPPTYSIHPPTNTTGGTYILRLHLDAVRLLSVTLFGEDSAYWTGQFDPSGSPVPLGGGPTPTPAP
ncbi:MAG: LCP family protein [Chloroflexi bacterium]|nr:LCP family protein [Chloroflexota bacterium]